MGNFNRTELYQTVQLANAGPKAMLQLTEFTTAVKLNKQLNQYLNEHQSKHPPGWIDQISRSTQSVAANIAEGYGRFTPAQQVQFYRVAVGSAYEAFTLATIASPELPEDLVKSYLHTANTVSKALADLCTDRLSKGY